MEEKIYMRQVSKTQLAQRVVDEHQLDRHFTYQELKELYSFYPDVYDENVEPSYDMPKDDVLKSLLLNNKNLIVKYHEHDSLLENKIDEGLTEEERQTAWQQYEQESQKLKSEEEMRKKMMEQAMAAHSALQTAINNQTIATGTSIDANNIQTSPNHQPPINQQGDLM
jgi:transcriptional regulator ATRX